MNFGLIRGIQKGSQENVLRMSTRVPDPNCKKIIEEDPVKFYISESTLTTIIICC